MYKWIALILVLLGIDQVSKALVVSHFSALPVSEHSIPVIKNFFYITYTRNSGAVFGSFDGIARYFYIFLIFVVIAAVVFGYLFAKTDFKDKRNIWIILALSLLIAGTLGNGIDRAFQPDHYVVDFIDFSGIWHYIFNFADVCLNIGIVLFLVDTFFFEPKRRKLKNG